MGDHGMNTAPSSRLGDAQQENNFWQKGWRSSGGCKEQSKGGGFWFETREKMCIYSHYTGHWTSQGFWRETNHDRNWQESRKITTYQAWEVKPPARISWKEEF